MSGVHRNGTADLEQRVEALEETSAAHSHVLGHVAAIQATQTRLADRQDSMGGDIAKINVRIGMLCDRLGVVETKAEGADAKAELLETNIKRASLTNEANAERGELAALGKDTVRVVRDEMLEKRREDNSARRRIVVRLAYALIALATAGSWVVKLEKCSADRTEQHRKGTEP